MKFLLILLSYVFLGFFGLIGSASGDVLKIETNNWRYSRDLTWTCRFLKLDRQSGIAEFEYMNGGNRRVFSVHVTRIYSLVIDDDSRVNRAFPSTRERLEIPLPTDLNQPRSIELTNEHFPEDEIPADVRRRNDGGKVFLRGALVAASEGAINLRALTVDRTDKEFEIDRAHLLRWIR